MTQTIPSDKVERRFGMEPSDKTSIPLIKQEFPLQILWRNVLFFIFLHAASFYSIVLFFTGQMMWQTFVWGFFLIISTGISITAGCHRLWAHKSYKAKIPLQILLLMFQTMAAQKSVYDWCRDHRVHHKYSETNADPHNAKCGFFFSQIGWLMCKKHPAVKEKGRGVSMTDIEHDPLLAFQRRYYWPLMLILNFVIPTLVPMIFWNELFIISFLSATQFRFGFCLHVAGLVNSVAHLWGSKPYNKSIYPSENKWVSMIAFGEGWHNYHHTFPWDYKTGELGNYEHNLTTAFIDAMAWLGLAYDLKVVDKSMVTRTVMRTGDLTIRPI